MSDFMDADIDKLLNEVPEPEEKDVNDIFAEYDRELMAFHPRSSRPQWPQPIRKRICTK